MSKIMFVGDIHLTGINPGSRKETPEQYRELLLNKLNQLKDICNNLDIHNIIILGDLFNNNSGISNLFETEIWRKFIEFKENNIDVYTIVGNHDMLFQNDDEFKGTYLYKAFLAGIIKHLDTLDIDNTHIVGFDYNRDYKEAEDLSKYNICVAHSFYENSGFGGFGNCNLTDEKCVNLKYNAYVLGHDHVPYDIMNKNNYYVIRPGSLTRGTSKTCNLYRDVQVAVFDNISFSWEYIKLKIKPGLDVFNESVIMSKDYKIDVNDILENLEISSYTNVYDIIDSNTEQAKDKLKDNYDDVLKIVETYFESHGLFRQNKEVN